MTENVKLKLEYLNEENFNGLGDIIQNQFEGKTPLLDESFFNHYGPLAFLECDGPVEFGITRFKKRPLVLEKLEQHAQTPEMLYAIDDDFIMPVAPIVYKNGESYPDIDKIKAIRVKQGDGVIFNDGIWHWAPFPATNEKSSVLVGFKKGTAENDIIIKELGKIFEIVE